MTQQSGNQFDDLTVGNENDGSFSTDSIDLFEFTGAEESPIARLKTIILSIDWEINDDILQQLDAELVDLGEIWADDKIKQVYIQGLNKIGKYIYKEKASAHPNSIKLLLTFYHNLEKIVTSDESMSEEEKKDILLEDVQKFDQLKAQIGKNPPTESKPVPKSTTPAQDSSSDPLLDLKALVLGLDWEITDQGLQKLQDEVKKLEDVFRENQAKRILLQGIGAVSAYIDKMRSQSNSKSFSLLHSFCDALEKITLTGISAENEKKLLLSEVAKFNAFKVEIAKAPSQDTSKPSTKLPPAARAPEAEESPKKKRDTLADSLPVDHSEDEEQVASDVKARLASVFGGMDEPEGVAATDKNIALEGVNIETEADDDSDEEALPYENGAVAPALSDAEEESSFSVEKLAGDLVGEIVDDDPVEDESVEDSVLPGVDVETEADDDSDEDALPVVDGEIAPALAGSFDDEDVEESEEESPSEDLDDRLDSFFDDEVETSLSEWGAGKGVDTADEDSPAAALSSDFGDNVESVAAVSDIGTEEELFPERPVEEDLEVAPAFELEEEPDTPAGGSVEDDVEEQLSMFDDDESSEVPGSIASLSSALADAVDVEGDSELGEEVSLSDSPADLMDDEPAEGSPVTMAEGNEGDDSFSTEDLLVEDDDSPVIVSSEKETEFEPAPALSSEEDPESEPAPALSSEEDPESEPAPALSSEEETEFEPVPALSSEEETEFEPASALSSEEDPESEPAPALSSEEDIESEPTPALSSEEELLTDSEDEEENLLDENSAAFEDSEDVENELADSDDETLSFLDEEIDEGEGNDFDEPDVELDEEIALEEDLETEEVDELFDTEDIEFTVPGEDLADTHVATEIEDEELLDDVIEFQVPGEDVDDILGTSGTDVSEVIFEAVGDDEEVDLLPGEEYLDSEESIETAALNQAENGIGASEVKTNIESDEAGPAAYDSLESNIESYKENSSRITLEHLLCVVNDFRGNDSSDYTSKIYLQLLSTVCQSCETNLSDEGSEHFSLMDEILVGLKMNSDSEVTIEQGQEQLLRCTSQVLLLQQITVQEDLAGKNDQGLAGGDEPDGIDSTSTAETPPAITNKDSTDINAEESLKAFVQEELADIRKIFLDEISSLRKEFRE